MAILPLGFSVRIGVVMSVGKTYVDFKFLDRLTDKTYRAPFPHPYAGRGCGIFVGIEKSTLIIVAAGPSDKWYILGTIPDNSFYFDVSGANNLKYFETSYPSLSEGEICLKGSRGQQVKINNDGNICLDAGIGSSAGDFELSKETGGLFLRTENVYSFSESGRRVEGIVKRDMRKEEPEQDTAALDFLTGETYVKKLLDIGRSPNNPVQKRTAFVTKKTVRNPALVEKREVVYEYANSFNVRDVGLESGAIVEQTKTEDIKNVQAVNSTRENRQTDVLDLDLHNYNHLIEKIEGTVVDIYGNVLDINRNKISVPDLYAENFKTNAPDEEQLRNIYNYLRRSVKYHFEINSRKDKTIEEQDPDNKTKSRWSIDVDAEGLTKVNIPSTSETGNIPVLARYSVSRDENDKYNGAYKEENRIDVKSEQFGAKGQQIQDTGYISSDFTIGTAFHEIMDIASSILSGGKLANPDPYSTENTRVDLLQKKINNKIGDEKANAGGRSLQANLDGSVEVSVGADTIDQKSLVIDTAGSMIFHCGKDKNGRSAVQHFDGDVIVQIGGKGLDNVNRPGRIEIHLTCDTGQSQKVIIDQNGLTLDIQGFLLLKSSGNLILDGGRVLINGELVDVYGGYDEKTGEIKGTERMVIRDGQPIT